MAGQRRLFHLALLAIAAWLAPVGTIRVSEASSGKKPSGEDEQRTQGSGAAAGAASVADAIWGDQDAVESVDPTLWHKDHGHMPWASRGDEFGDGESLWSEDTDSIWDYADAPSTPEEHEEAELTEVAETLVAMERALWFHFKPAEAGEAWCQEWYESFFGALMPDKRTLVAKYRTRGDWTRFVSDTARIGTMLRDLSGDGTSPRAVYLRNRFWQIHRQGISRARELPEEQHLQDTTPAPGVGEQDSTRPDFVDRPFGLPMSEGEGAPPVELADVAEALAAIERSLWFPLHPEEGGNPVCAAWYAEFARRVGERAPSQTYRTQADWPHFIKDVARLGHLLRSATEASSNPYAVYLRQRFFHLHRQGVARARDLPDERPSEQIE